MSETPFQALVLGRRSIRKFLPDPVGREAVLACLEAARRAPSAHNGQPWRFLVVDDPALKQRLAEGAFRGIYQSSLFAARAPVLVALLADRDNAILRAGQVLRRVPFAMVDMGIAGAHIALQAQELGLGTCWIGWFDERGARKALGVPKRYRIVALMPIGRAEKRPMRERPLKPRREVVWWNGAGEAFAAPEDGAGTEG